MGIFDGFAEGLASAIDDIRHQVVEQPMYGQQTTGNIELPQVEAPTIEAPATGAYQEPNSNIINVANAPDWGVSSAEIWNNEPPMEMPVEPVSWQQAAQGIEAPQIEAPQQTQDMER
mgnify:CR=1 FL=1